MGKQSILKITFQLSVTVTKHPVMSLYIVLNKANRLQYILVENPLSIFALSVTCISEV